MDFLKTRFAVIGLGDTGISIVNYLIYKGASNITLFDTRVNPPNYDKFANYKLILGDLKYDDFVNIDVIVLSPGLSIYHKAIQQAINNGIKVVGDIELFALEINKLPVKVIGITGSNGKTTVTTLTGYLAEKLGYKTLVAGNIGTPVLKSFIEFDKTATYPELIVLELSSFQLETTYSLTLDSATVLNLSEDHLDRYRDLLEYAYVKANIFNNSKVQVLNSDDKLVMAMARQSQKKFYFGSNAQDYSLAYYVNELYLCINQQRYLKSNDLRLIGKHNYYNVLASIALLSSVGIDIHSLPFMDSLKSFQGLEHRMQKVLIHNNITYIEDSKGTNVGAVVAGISGIDGVVHLLLGGDGKGQDFSPLRDVVKNKCASVAIIGQDKYKILESLNGINKNIQLFDKLEDAVVFLINNAKPSDYVILSPACASWDMFNNYKHRAEVYIQSIKNTLYLN